MKSYFVHTEDMALASKEGVEPFHLSSDVELELKRKNDEIKRMKDVLEALYINLTHNDGNLIKLILETELGLYADVKEEK